jgi:hypothetical protein
LAVAFPSPSVDAAFGAPQQARGQRIGHARPL